MKIKAVAYDSIELEEVFNPIKLISAKKEKISIVMRDEGFEIWYQDKPDNKYHTYEFKNGIVRKMNDISKSLEKDPNDIGNIEKI